VGCIDNGKVPCLIESKEQQKGNYCTLSYRWGSEPVTLRLDNLAALKEGLPFAELPMTIQHAIGLTSRLGFKYLWVDALCIIQDSEADWEAEAAKMDSIYSNSTITIAAVDLFEDSAGTPGGLFTIRRPMKAGEMWRPNGVLDTRGWVTQEQALSRRILSFTSAGIFWSCTKWDCSEDFPAGIPDNSKSTYDSIHTVQKWALEPTRDSGYDVWGGLLRDYTSRDLSEESDRLIAIKGIASFFSTRLGGELVAGIWRGNFLKDLSWCSDPLGGRAFTGLPRPKSYKAPSWSWGSVVEPIRYMKTEPHLSSVELLDFSAHEDGKGSFSGSITLKAPFIPVHLGYCWLSFEPGFPIDEKYVDCIKKGAIWRPDEVSFRSSQGFSLDMGGYGLCLVPVAGRSNTSKRVGICQWSIDLAKSLFCCYFEPKVVTIV
jgi:Heterokaryon incompatibility protein (HET)